MATSSDPALRIDRFLWFTRFFKTRTLAGKAVTGGHVRINGEHASPGTRVAPGDRVEVVRDRLTWQFDVLAIPARRGPAAEARACYRETEASAERRETLAAELRSDRLQMPRTRGRPDKRTRRLLRERKSKSR